MIQIGVRAHDFGKQTPEVLAEKVSEAGFTSIQLALNKALSDYVNVPGNLTPGYGNYIRNVFSAQGVDIAIMGCYINPVNTDTEQLESDLQNFEQHLRHARDFGCAVVATETGWRDWDTTANPGKDHEEAFLGLVKVVRRLADTAETFGTIVGIEGVAHNHTIRTHELMVRLLEMVDSPNVKVVYDPVNFIPNERCADHEKHIDEAFEMFGDQIVSIHAKDFTVNNGIKEGDLPAGKGMMNYRHFLNILQNRKPGIHILLENNTPETMAESIRHLKSNA